MNIDSDLYCREKRSNKYRNRELNCTADWITEYSTCSRYCTMKESVLLENQNSHMKLIESSCYCQICFITSNYLYLFKNTGNEMSCHLIYSIVYLFKKGRYNMWKIWLVSLFLILFFNACSEDSTSSSSGDPPANEIWIENNAFRPSSKTIAAGTTITWVNKDNINHTATSGSGSPTGVFDSGTLGNGQSFSFKFDSVNTFGYYCKVHPSMRGTIIVQ